MMNKAFKRPPQSPKELSTLEDLKQKLLPLIGTNFTLTGKSRTDGSNIRKLIAKTLEKYPLPKPADEADYEIVPPKNKGIPKITLEFIDSYVVTSGKSYNLQVWNRLPASLSLLVKYESGESLKCTDVRFVFTKIDLESNKVSTIVLLTPKYIVDKFGAFGKPTVKHQLLISSKIRQKILRSSSKILFFKDSTQLSYLVTHNFELPQDNTVKGAKPNKILSIDVIKIMVAEKLIGYKLAAGSTKNRGQALERRVLELLGHSLDEKNLLHGGFPDIPSQLLEVKVQDTQTVDLGRFTPEKEEWILEDLNVSTFDIRYLIALTNPETEKIEGIILAPGQKLGELFSYVARKSYKCQRSIPMDFFNKYSGQVVVNPG